MPHMFWSLLQRGGMRSARYTWVFPFTEWTPAILSFAGTFTLGGSFFGMYLAAALFLQLSIDVHIVPSEFHDE